MTHTNSLQRIASWVVRRKSTGEVLFETYSARIVAALNMAQFEAVPIAEHLASLNRKG